LRARVALAMLSYVGGKLVGQIGCYSNSVEYRLQPYLSTPAKAGDFAFVHCPNLADASYRLNEPHDVLCSTGLEPVKRP
jgi:hypothetical protein